jgi:hypothetical protein
LYKGDTYNNTKHALIKNYKSGQTIHELLGQIKWILC